MIGKKVYGCAEPPDEPGVFSNSRLYLAMAAYFESIGMEGCREVDGIAVPGGDGPCDAALRASQRARCAHRFCRKWLRLQPNGRAPLAAFEAAYEHECKVTREFDEHVELARAEKDNATLNFLQWFVD